MRTVLNGEHSVFMPVHLLPPITQRGIDGYLVEFARVHCEGKNLCRDLWVLDGGLPRVSDKAVQVVGDPVQALRGLGHTRSAFGPWAEWSPLVPCARM